MQVHVLLDSNAKVCGVVTDPTAAEDWLTFDDTFAVVVGMLDDYGCFNVALEAVVESKSF